VVQLVAHLGSTKDSLNANMNAKVRDEKKTEDGHCKESLKQSNSGTKSCPMCEFERATTIFYAAAPIMVALESPRMSASFALII
jgi:hypothetical protein